MRRVLRWLRNALLGLIALVLIAAMAVYLASERIVRRTHEVDAPPFAARAESNSLAEGERLARLHGCLGCHGQNLEGKVFIDEPLLAHIVSPNLTIAVREYSDAQLERIIRHGIRPNGRSVVAMPSGMFSQLTDDDLGRILAYLRSAPPVIGHAREVRLGPLARLGVVIGRFAPAVDAVRRAEALSPEFPRAGDSTAAGAYLARTVCTECHGLDLNGGERAPDLRIAAGYTREQFSRLMRTGKALGDRELTLMSQVARSRFSRFTDQEVEALYGYLIARGGAATGRRRSPVSQRA